MSCLIGRKVVNPHYKKYAPDNHYLLYGDRDDYYINVDCGVCINCINKYKSSWKFRLEKEFEYMPIEELKRTYYVTLTMEPRFYGESRKHISTLIRRFLERYRKDYGKSMRHFFISERGEDDDGEHRIHLHGFLINIEHPNLIWKYWAYGFVKVKPLFSDYGIVEDFIGYCSGYITKFNDSDIIVDKFDKPMVFVSKGLGKQYSLDPRYISMHHRNSTLFPMTFTSQGKLRSLPRYLRKKVFTDDELEAMKIDYFNNQSDDVIPDPPYYIGTQIYQDYTAYLNDLEKVKSEYLKKYPYYVKQSNGAYFECASEQAQQDKLG